MSDAGGDRAAGGGPGAPVAVLLTLLAAALRLYGLGQQSLWTDEAHTIMVAGIPRSPAVPPWHPRDLLHVTQGPLFMGLAHYWARLVGTGEAALRLLPALFSIATVPLFLALAGRLCGRRAAGFGGLLLAVSPFHVWYGQELRGYSLLMLAAVAATLDLVEILRGAGGIRRYLLYAASVTAGLGASLTMVFLLPVHALAAAARARRSGRRGLLGIALAWLLVLLLAAPWLGVFGTRHDVGRAVDRAQTAEAPLRGATTMPALAVPYTFYAFAAGFSLGPTPAALHAPGRGLADHAPVIALVAVLYGSLTVGGLLATTARRPATAFFLVVWIAIPFALAAWLALTNVKVWNARYVAVAYPAFLLAVAAGLAALPAWPRRLVTVLVLALSLVGLWNLRRDPAYAKEDYRSAGAYLDRHLAPADALIGVGAPAPVFLYAERRPATYLLVHPHRIGDEAELRQRLGAAADDHPRVWLLRARPYQSDPANHVGEILAETRARADRQVFPGIELERYDAATGATGDPPALAPSR
jgi:4-amino-4-deoxy-L-arabinose transferase-like glycosyltransferase